MCSIPCYRITKLHFSVTANSITHVKIGATFNNSDALPNKYSTTPTKYSATPTKYSATPTNYIVTPINNSAL